MNLVFQQGSTLVLTNGTTSRKLLVESATLSQTYLEESRSVRTLHSNNIIAETFTNSKSNTSIEFSFYLTNSEDLIFEWFGFSKQLSKFILSPYGVLPAGFDIYLLSTGAVYKVSGVHATTFSFNMSKEGPIKLAVSAVGVDWTEVPSIPSFPSLSSQDSLGFNLSSITLEGYSNLAGITIEMTKDVSWLQDKSLHSVLSGNIYTSSKAICNDFAVSGSISNYKRDNIVSHSNNVDLRINYGDFMEIFLSPCRIFDRLDISEVHRKISDYKLLPSTTNSYIQF